MTAFDLSCKGCDEKRKLQGAAVLDFHFSLITTIQMILSTLLCVLLLSNLVSCRFQPQLLGGCLEVVIAAAYVLAISEQNLRTLDDIYQTTSKPQPTWKKHPHLRHTLQRLSQLHRQNSIYPVQDHSAYV
jgi:hypothetical protein